MADSADSLSAEERAFLAALNELGVRYMLVGMSAALVQGATVATDDLDLWFEHTTTGEFTGGVTPGEQVEVSVDGERRALYRS